jgi:hypothetical protein
MNVTLNIEILFVKIQKERENDFATFSYSAL